MRTETCPYTDHEVCILAMYFLDHSFSTMIGFGQEIHGIPKVVATPILPVLDDTIQRHIVCTVPIHHFEQFLRSLIAFAALPIAECPQGEHGHFTTECTHLGVYTIGRASPHEVVIDGIAHFGREFHAIGIVNKIGT